MYSTGGFSALATVTRATSGRFESVGDLVKAFIWQLITHVGEDSLAHGLFPTEDEKLSRSESTLGAMWVAGNVALLGSGVIAPVAVLTWILLGRGPGERLLAFGAGGARPGQLLVARASRSGALPERPTP